MNLFDFARVLLEHEKFVEATREIFQGEEVQPGTLPEEITKGVNEHGND